MMTVTASNFARVANDLYQTEAWATLAFLRHFPMVGRLVWEPASGKFAMVDVLREHGATVIASDIICYGWPNHFYDFLSDPFRGVAPVDAIVTNPPYGKQNRDAVRFAELALKRCVGYVALLLTAKFDFGSTRVHLFRDNPRFVAKIALIDRIQWFEGDHGGTEDHAWYVWQPIDMPPAPPRLIWEGK